MSKTGTTARWTASTGASLVLLMVVALIGAPVVGAGPGEDGGIDHVAGLFGGDGPSFFGGGGDEGDEESGAEEGGAEESGAEEDGEKSGDEKEGDKKGGHDHGDHGGGPAVAGRAMGRGETTDYGIAIRARGEGEDARGRLAFGHHGDEGGDGFYGMITCLSVGEDGVVQVSGVTHEGRGHKHGDHRGGRGHKGDKGEEGDESQPEEGAEAEEPAPAAFAKGGRHGGSPDDHGEGEKGDGENGGGEEGSEDEPASRDFAFTINTKSDPQTFSMPKLGDAGTLAPCGGGEATTLDVTRGGFRVRSGS